MKHSRFPTQALRDAAKVCEGVLEPTPEPDPMPASRNFDRSHVDYASLLVAQMNELDTLEMEMAA